MRPFSLKMRLRRESLLGAEAPNVFHALPGGPPFLAAPKKGAKKVACASLAAPMICGKNLIQSSRLHLIKSISPASPFIPQFKINYLIHLSEPPPSIGQLLSRQSRAGFGLRLVGWKKEEIVFGGRAVLGCWSTPRPFMNNEELMKFAFS